MGKRKLTSVVFFHIFSSRKGPHSQLEMEEVMKGENMRMTEVVLTGRYDVKDARVLLPPDHVLGGTQ